MVKYARRLIHCACTNTLLNPINRVMVHFYHMLVAVALAFACFGEVSSIPLAERMRSLTPKAKSVLKRATPVAPRFVLYSDAYVSTEPTASDINVGLISSCVRSSYLNY